ncbi:MAG: hypothetical protein K2L48_04100 [Mycoplasmoidaceae bacterium]|nr:hypothetical protein [Mycoplasmoidaceae bacterium]
MYTSLTLNYKEITEAFLPLLPNIQVSDIMLGSITNDAIMNFVHTDINLLLITSGFISIYTFVRLG